jgi:nitroreductase
MDVFEAIQKRKSARSYETKPVPKEILEKLLEAARLSPSAKNLQPWHFIVVTEAEKRKALSKGLYAKFLSQTPAVIVLCGDEKASPDWYVVDVALAGENMVIAATSEGLGTCWVGSFDEEQVKELLEIPKNLRVVALMAVGYAKDKASITSKVIQFLRKRKTLSEIASWEIYGHKLEGKKA